MPKKPRTREEVDAVKENILDQALQLIEELGMDGLTMRRLAGRLGVKAVTIYSYYESKDHLYLAVLTKGFQMLHVDCLAAYDSSADPMLRLRAMTRAYLDFGINNANFYNIMFTWHVPKFQDYVDTPMEDAARFELEESQKVYLLFIQAAKEIAPDMEGVTNEQAQEAIIFFWSTLHGYIAGINNSLLTYMHADPLDLREPLLENLFKYVEQGLVEASRVETEK